MKDGRAKLIILKPSSDNSDSSRQLITYLNIKHDARDSLSCGQMIGHYEIAFSHI